MSAGGFNSVAFGQDFDLITKGQLQQVCVLEIDVGAVGKEFQLPLPMACNAFTLVSGVADESGNIQLSSSVAVLALRFNDRNQKALLFSLVAANGDLRSFSGVIGKIYARVVTADAGKKIYCLGLLAAGVTAVTGVSGFNPPAGEASVQSPSSPSSPSSSSSSSQPSSSSSPSDSPPAPSFVGGGRYDTL